ncbi:hypothetical protein JIR001_24460 [Polycladomyces abyssicola]|uniref:Uncharacterized protein n=1 Tax=Polycladomyces abyssicola TaxID=1125966 RepID=A0A8D5UH71_9BACL|nr:hypothetical protein [Polycladomyces abyssicola]BCU82663.1 hypothetical protein JIR001_24460 [Polycladomyces abyssicola]
MAVRWTMLGMWLLVSLLAGCQWGDDFQSGTRVSHLSRSESAAFVPYADREVPSLRSLIARKGFQQYASQHAYLLGYSYDGVFLAVMTFDREAQAYRIQLYHTVQQRIEETLYVPSAERLHATDDSQKQSEAEEQLQIAQETIDMGYRIKAPAKPLKWRFDQAVRIPGPGNYLIRTDWKTPTLSILVQDGQGRKWKLAQQDWRTSALRPASEMYVIRHPDFPDRWTVVGASIGAQKGPEPFFCSMEIDALRPERSEQSLSRLVNTVLPGGGNIVFRGELTKRGYGVLLAVQEALPPAVREPGIVYQGIAKRFVIIDDSGRAVDQGGSNGLVHQGRILSAGQSLYYRIVLIARNPKQKADLLLVDQLEPNGKVKRTFEWIWDESGQRFQLLQ